MIDSLRIKYRRWKLRRAYSTLVARRDGMDGALSGTMATLVEMERDGIITLKDGETIWHWPDGDWR